MNFIRTAIILILAHVIVGIFLTVLMFVLSDFHSLDYYPFLPILGGMMFIIMNLGFYKHFSYKLTRLICVVLISLSFYHCYVTDSHWRYAKALIEHHEKNYTQEWYCALPYIDKLVIESYTFHAIEECNPER